MADDHERRERKETGNRVLVVDEISKTFPGVIALNGVHFDLARGEVHALMGENGAGKSTLIKILGGIYTPDSGQIVINGKPASITHVRDALQLGISIVHQELSLVEDMSVAENLFLGKERRSAFGFVDRIGMEREAMDVLDRFGTGIRPEARVSSLSLGQKQIVEIAKALLDDARIIIMDEPTASLTKAETEKLFDVIASLKAHDCAILYVSHRMDEIFRLSDRITVFRDGQYIATRQTSETTTDELIRLMVGRQLEVSSVARGHIAETTGLEVDGLSSENGVSDVSFQVGKGEIVGFYGLIGAGRTELARAIFGIDRRSGGTIRIDGADMRATSPADVIRSGIALVPESRKEQGLVMNETMRFNTTLVSLAKCLRGIFVSQEREDELARHYVASLQIKVAAVSDPVSGLSGGNQQKIVLAKWLSANPKVLILDEPTRGIDVGAKAQIYRVVQELAAKGLTIMFISSDLPEVMHISDRLYVMRAGRIVSEFQHGNYIEENILSSASGVEDARTH